MADIPIYFGPRGPYGTELEAISASGQRDWAPEEHRTRNLALLADSIDEAGVELGSYDRRIIEWIAQTWEPQTVEVLAAIIQRASESTGSTRQRRE